MRASNWLAAMSAVGVAVFVGSSTFAQLVVDAEEAGFVAEPPIKNVDEQAAYEQVGTISVGVEGAQPLPVQAFCLGSNGDILAACGIGPGEIRVLDADGKYRHAWKVDIRPEAINVAPDGSVLVAGHGRILRFTPQGKPLQAVDSPHAVAVRANAGKLREQATAQLRVRTNQLEAQIENYERILAELTAKKEKNEELNQQEEQVLAFLGRALEGLKAQQAAQPPRAEPAIDEAAVTRQVEAMSRAKLRIASISADERHVYLATPSLTGYTFEVWRLEKDLTGGEVIVTDLRGCCGQMDVQVSRYGVFVAENARHRVACFKPDGEMVTNWGGRDREGLTGFTSCCNPMNVCFNPEGDVFTAESSTGRIKRFSPSGELKEYVGDVKLVPGCKNVSIAVSPDNQRVYMLDITRNHIVLMTRKPAAAPASE